MLIHHLRQNCSRKFKILLLLKYIVKYNSVHSILITSVQHKGRGQCITRDGYEMEMLTDPEISWDWAQGFNEHNNGQVGWAFLPRSDPGQENVPLKLLLNIICTQDQAGNYRQKVPFHVPFVSQAFHSLVTNTHTRTHTYMYLMPEQLDFFWNIFLFLTTFKSRKEEEICCFGANRALSLDLVLLLFFFIYLMHLDLNH